MKFNPIQELDGRIAQIAIWIITLSLYLAIGENILNQSPLSLIITNCAIAIMLTILVLTQNKWRADKVIVRWLFVAFSLIILPVAWLSSKGSFGAQPIYMAFYILLASLVLERKWALLLSATTMLTVTLLMSLEYFNILSFIKVGLPRELILSNLIHYMIVYIMFMGVGVTFKKHYNSFQQHYYRQSIYDDLTQLNNRRYLINALSQLVSESQRHHRPFSVLFLDIDRFKQVNDKEGHVVGDSVLALLGKIISEGLREYDIGGRYGGDEIMVLLPHTTPEDAMIIADRISKTFIHLVKSITAQPISLSIGIVESHDKTAQEIIRSADEAMYSKKNSDGGNHD